MNERIEFIEEYIRVDSDWQYYDNHGVLIRCKDCVCFRTDEKGITYCASMGVQMKPEDFCSYGERRTK